MHDLASFRANLDAIAQRLATRGYQLDIDQFRALDAERRAALTDAEQLKAQKNAKSAEVGKLRREGHDTAAIQEEVRQIGDRITALDEKAKAADVSFRELIAGVPNIPHESVPVGSSEKDNVEIRRWGQPRQFDFPPKAHWDLGADLKICISGIKVHQDAGYGGGAKAILPGLAALPTVEYNHTQILTKVRTTGPVKIFQNDMRLDMIEAARMAKVDYTLQILYNDRLRPTQIWGGGMPKNFLRC